MTTETMVLIQYIGKQPKKSDSVNPGSGRVWPHPGAAIEVPSHEKWAYLAHPEIWALITPEDYEAHLDSKSEREAAEAEWMAFITRKLPVVPIETIRRVVESCQQELMKRAAATPAKPVRPPRGAKTVTTLEDVMKPGADPAMVSAFMGRATRIASVIRNSMDLREDTQAINGWPRAEAIQSQGLLGWLPTQDEIAEAMSMLGHEHAAPPAAAA